MIEDKTKKMRNPFLFKVGFGLFILGAIVFVYGVVKLITRW